MKRFYILTLIAAALSMTSCEDWFLETPEVTGMSADDVFSTYKNAEGAIAEVYGNILSSGLPVYNWIGEGGAEPYVPYEATEAIMGGEDVCSIGWAYMDKLCMSGMIPNDANRGAGYTDDYFPNNFMYIRKAWLVYENIGRVPDMTDQQKNIVQAEMKTLVAFRYLEMLKRYGGVPIVEKTLTAEVVVPRSSVEDVIDFILRLCDEAIPELDKAAWGADMLGRVTKGVALAVKAETLMYAARPLFNADAPYMDMPNPADNNLICLNGYDKERWKTAAEANEAVIEWGKANNFILLDTDNPNADFGTAVGTPGNREVLLAYKHHITNDLNGLYKNYSFVTFNTAHDLGWYRGVSFEMLSKFRKADGTDQHWINAGEELDHSIYRTKAMEMEPRALMSLFFYGVNPQNNILSGNEIYDVNGTDWHLLWKGADGCARLCKFWYEADGREWFEFPIYRMAEFYLNAAEAYNEYGNATKAKEYLNAIRDRGGLEDVNESDQGKLRSLIQREWAVEFYNENQWYPHARHWKMGDTMVGGMKHSFTFTNAPGVSTNPRRPEEFGTFALKNSYVGEYAWKDRMYLTPITLGEVNKGVIKQNPGY